MKLKQAVQDALDGVTDNKYAKWLREPAITVHQFADVLGVSVFKAKTILLNLRGTNIIDRRVDPTTGNLVLTTESIISYLERQLSLEEERAMKKADAEKHPTSPYADGPAVYSIDEAAEMFGMFGIEDIGRLRDAVQQNRIPGFVTRNGAFVLGGWARQRAEEIKRAKAAAAADAKSAEEAEAEVRQRILAPSTLNGWVPVKEAAKLLGLKPGAFVPGVHRGGQIVVARVNGEWQVGGPGLQKALEAAERRRAER